MKIAVISIIVINVVISILVISSIIRECKEDTTDEITIDFDDEGED